MERDATAQTEQAQQEPNGNNNAYTHKLTQAQSQRNVFGRQ